MARSLKKGVYLDEKLLKKVKKSKEENNKKPIKTWSRSSMIVPEMVGFTFLVHNGKEFLSVDIREEMVGHRLGEFSPTTKFTKHGGRMERELAKTDGQMGGAEASKTSPAEGEKKENTK